MTGIFFPGDVVVLIITTICYFLCPKFILGERPEYVSFFLLFFSVYSLIVLIILNSMGTPIEKLKDIQTLYFVCMPLFMLIAHVTYPFRKVKRNRVFTFLLLIPSLIVYGFAIIAFTLHYFAAESMSPM